MIVGEKHGASPMCEGIIAAALLLTAPVDPPHPECPALAEVLRADILTLCVDAEVLDSSGEMARPPDLDTLRRRLVELHGAPLVGEAARFPGLDTIYNAQQLNRAARRRLEARLAIDCFNEDGIRWAIAECERRHCIWSALWDAQSSGYVVPRRHALALLRDLVGAPAFYSGAIPGPVP